MLCHANQAWIGRLDSEQVATHERGTGLSGDRLLQGNKDKVYSLQTENSRAEHLAQASPWE